MGEPTCSIPGCEGRYAARGWCAKHYRRWKLYGDPEALRRPAYDTDSVCSVEGCDAGPPLVRNWCGKHYSRWRQYGDPEATPKRVRRYEAGTACSVDGCGKPIRGRGWCGMHYMRWLTYGDPLFTFKRETCSVEGCDEKHQGRGFCAKHWRRWSTHGDPLALSKVPSYGGTQCSIEGCERAARKLGWCETHYANWLNKEHPERSRARSARRRAHKLALPCEDFDVFEIFERDAWVCQLCGEPVDRTLRFPDPQSASLDHILPLTRHGHHVRENCQLAHLRCNVRKGNRITA